MFYNSETEVSLAEEIIFKGSRIVPSTQTNLSPPNSIGKVNTFHMRQKVFTVNKMLTAFLHFIECW